MTNRTVAYLRERRSNDTDTPQMPDCLIIRALFSFFGSKAPKAARTESKLWPNRLWIALLPVKHTFKC